MMLVKKIYHGIVFIFVMLLFFVSFPLAYMLFGHKKIWLISEVDFDARDNGFHFFNFIRKNHPEINTIYLIDKNNPNYNIVQSIGKTVKPHSYKHVLIFIASKAKISTLVHGCSPSWCITKYLLKHHGTGKNIALKHGIFKNLHPNYFKTNAHLDLICCGGKPEFEFIDKEFGYQKGVAKYTGLARFDALHDSHADNEIFIMPTWRRWLDKIDTVSDFKQSDYYKKWSSLIKDSRLLKMADICNLTIYFYVHPKLNKFIDLFSTEEARIKFLNSKHGDSVQSHLKNASVLITDFSSVFFDFAYMRKPVIYYQFDERNYFDFHYKQAYFDYRKNGFGPVAQNTKDVLDELHKIIDNHNKLSNCYYQRAVDFFPLYDDKNCERIFTEINKVISK